MTLKPSACPLAESGSPPASSSELGDRSFPQRCGLMALMVALLGLAYWLLQQPGFQEMIDPTRLSDTVLRLGAYGPAIYIAVIATSVVISHIPGAPLAVAAGAIWGPWVAGLYTILGGALGALVAYTLGRTIGASIIQTLTGKTFRFSEQISEERLGWLIFGTRLIPIFSFDLVSYAAGMAKLSLPVYASATLLGMTPSTLMLTYVGSRVEPTGYFMLALIGLFTLLFVGVPLLIHRYNWLNLKTVVSWN